MKLRLNDWAIRTYRTLREEDKVNIFCFSKALIESYHELLLPEILDTPHIVISIRSNGAPKAIMPSNDLVKGRTGVLYVEAVDLTEHVLSAFPNLEVCAKKLKFPLNSVFDSFKAGMVADFVLGYIAQMEEEHPDIKPVILVNCEAGVSRSAGLCMALEDIYNKDSIQKNGKLFQDNKDYIPNTLFYKEYMNAYKERKEIYGID